MKNSEFETTDHKIHIFIFAFCFLSSFSLMLEEIIASKTNMYSSIFFYISAICLISLIKCCFSYRESMQEKLIEKIMKKKTKKENKEDTAE